MVNKQLYVCEQFVTTVVVVSNFFGFRHLQRLNVNHLIFVFEPFDQFDVNPTLWIVNDYDVLFFTNDIVHIKPNRTQFLWQDTV